MGSVGYLHKEVIITKMANVVVIKNITQKKKRKINKWQFGITVVITYVLLINVSKT